MNGVVFLPFESDAASARLQSSNIFTIAKRTVDGQDMLYQSIKLTNGIWVLVELRVQTGNPTYMVRGNRLQIKGLINSLLCLYFHFNSNVEFILKYPV